MRPTLSHRRRHRYPAAIATVVLSLSASGSVVAQPDQLVLQQERDGTYSMEEPGFIGHIDPDGSVRLENKPPLQLRGLGASFDLTDIAMRITGMDPYASAKLELLDRTRAMRAAMGERHRAQLLVSSADLMRRNIEAVLATVSDSRQRRQALFELWDECADSGDPALVAAGAAARATVLAYIQREMTGPNAYTAQELRALNSRRTSEIAFEPYARVRPDVRYAMATRRSAPFTSIAAR